MASKITICNMALSKLRAQRIEDFPPGDDSEEAILCELYWEPTVDEVLRSYPWSCALHRQSLAEVGSGDGDYLLSDTEEWQYQYKLPQDPYCLRVVKLIDQPTAPYKVEGRSLLCNLSKVAILYVKRAANPLYFDSLLVKAIAYRLAADLSVDIMNAPQVRQEILRLYDWQLRRAKSIDALENDTAESSETLLEDVGR